MTPRKPRRRVSPHAKLCAHCGVEFEKPPKLSLPQWEKRLLCSLACGRAWNSARHHARLTAQHKTCEECGDIFFRVPGVHGWASKKTCSAACSRRLISRRLAKQKQLTFPRTTVTHSEDGKRRCPKCNLRKPLEDFPKKGAQRNGDDRYGYCKPCHSIYQRHQRLASVFSLTVEEYEEIVAHQDGLCAICKRPPLKNRLAVDHAHATGLVRGALCWSCNKTLGFLREDITRMEAAIAYLRDPPAPHALGREVFARKGRTTNKRPRKGKRKAIRYLEQPPIRLPEEDA